MTHGGAAWRGSIVVAATAVVTSVTPLVDLDDHAVPWWPFELRNVLASVLVLLIVRLVSAHGRAFAPQAFVGRRVACRVLERSL